MIQYFNFLSFVCRLLAIGPISQVRYQINCGTGSAPLEWTQDWGVQKLSVFQLLPYSQECVQWGVSVEGEKEEVRSARVSF